MSDLTRIQIDLVGDVPNDVLRQIQNAAFVKAQEFSIPVVRNVRRTLATESQIEAARDEYPTQDFAIDPDAEITLPDDPEESGSDFGWVQAWVRVDSLPMPVTPERVRFLLREEAGDLGIPDDVLMEHAVARALKEIRLNHSPLALLSGADIIDELNGIDWEESA